MKLKANLDLLEEKQDKAAEQVAAYQSKIARCFNKMVKTRNFKEGDLVLRKVTQNTRKRSYGVLAPNWEGPYLIKIVVRKGAYKLKDMDGYSIDHTWNVDHLKRTRHRGIRPPFQDVKFFILMGDHDKSIIKIPNERFIKLTDHNSTLVATATHRPQLHFLTSLLLTPPFRSSIAPLSINRSPLQHSLLNQDRLNPSRRKSQTAAASPRSSPTKAGRSHHQPVVDLDHLQICRRPRSHGRCTFRRSDHITALQSLSDRPVAAALRSCGCCCFPIAIPVVQSLFGRRCLFRALPPSTAASSLVEMKSAIIYLNLE
ncbi:hypothetical protein LWI29_035952 [Acer saccharum]|uniref:Reverse transcriptase domain-containing protein n=1 Tax=Acer saccharum TaxID=4024 RepID=A0AA39UYH9_ACESA|nr:hypothetical protein LWI29_035952 [Acer saccharum]